MRLLHADVVAAVAARCCCLRKEIYMPDLGRWRIAILCSAQARTRKHTRAARTRARVNGLSFIGRSRARSRSACELHDFRAPSAERHPCAIEFIAATCVFVCVCAFESVRARCARQCVRITRAHVRRARKITVVPTTTTHHII